MYREALSLDKEMAQAYMESPDFEEEPKDPRPRMSDDSATVVMLRDIANQIRALRSDTITVAGGKAGKMDYLKPPKTAMESAAYERRRRDHLSLAARLLPHKREQLLGEISGD